MITKNRLSARFARGIAVLGIAGLLSGVIATAPAQADPPRKIFGVRTNRDQHNDRDNRNGRGYQKGHDKNWDKDHKWDKNHSSDRARIERERLDRERRDRERAQRERSAYRSDRDHDGTPDRYDKHPDDRRRH